MRSIKRFVMATAVAVLSGWVLGPGGASAVPIVISASEDITKFGNLKQGDVTNCPNDACGPTSATNSFVFLQNTSASAYDKSLIEHDPNNVNNDPYKDLVFTANKLTTDAYMRTCAVCGTFPDDFAVGKDRWFNGFGNTPGHAPPTTRTIFKIEDEFAWGAGNPTLPPDRKTPPSYFKQMIPDDTFFLTELRGREDIEILLNGDPNHWVTVTSFSFTDTNGDNKFDDAETGTIGFIDPADGANHFHSMKLNPAGEIIVDYRDNLTFSARIVSAESESAPAPGTLILLVVGLGSMAVTRRLRRAA
jgi:hypothetical protein